MHHNQTFIKRVIILGLITAVSCIPILFILSFLKDAKVVFSLLNDYIYSGKSVIIPWLPNENLFGENTFVYFSVGHLVDLIIFANIEAFIQRIIYYQYVRICLDPYPLFFGLYDYHQEQGFFFGSGYEKEDEMNEEILRVDIKRELENDNIFSSLNLKSSIIIPYHKSKSLKKLANSNYDPQLFNTNNSFLISSYCNFLDSFSLYNNSDLQVCGDLEGNT